MNKKIIGYGSIALAVLLLFAFSFISLQDDSQQVVKRGLIPNIASPGLSYNGVNLTDHTVFNETSNTCTAQNQNMKIKIYPCVAFDVDGREIKQDVNFEWGGTQPQNTSWIFVYEGGQLESGKIEVLKNVTQNYWQNVSHNQFVNNVQIGNITAFVNLGSPDSRCELGNTNNTQMYNVTRNVNGTAFTQVYCFTSANQINAQTYSLSGNRNVWQMEQVAETSTRYVDVTNQIQYLGYGLLNDNRSYYRVQDVQFQPGQKIESHWSFTPQNITKVGKWHIVGYDSNVGLTQSLSLGKYIYVDPWWDVSWSRKQPIYINTTTSITNASVLINVPYDSDMLSNFGDIRFLNSSESGELNYWFYNNTCIASTSCQMWVRVPTTINPATNMTIYMYYGNPSAVTTSNIDNAFLFGDDFNGSAVNWANRWQSTDHSVYAVASGLLDMQKPASSNGKISTNWTFTKYISETRFKSDSSANENIYLISSDTNPTTYGGSDIINLQGGAWRMLAFGGSKTGGTAAANTFYRYIARNNDTGAGSCLNATTDAGVNLNSTCGTAASTGAKYPGFLDFAAATHNYIDWFFIRTYVENEPIYNFGPEELNSGVASTLSYPSNGFVTNSTNITFQANATASGASTLDNITIYVWNATDNALFYSNTQVISGTSNSSVWNGLFGDGDWIWNALVSGDSGTVTDWASNFTFSVDRALPQISIVAPTNATVFTTLTVPYNVSFNYSLIEGHPQACWFNNETANISLAACGNNFSILYGSGYHTVKLYANDSAGNLGQNQTSFLINRISTNMSFPTPVVEAQPFNVTLNITAPLINTINGTLNYNGTLYPMNIAQQNSTFGQLILNVSSPSNITNNLIMSVGINYSVNGYNFSTGQQNQTVLYLTPLVVAASCNDKAIAFNALDEQNLTSLNVDINYNFKFGFGSNNTLKAVYGSLTNVNPFYLCINSTVSNAYTLGYGEIDYQATGGTHVLRRYYTFEGRVLSNVTENITLYDLPNSAATSFLVEAKDQTLNPYVQKFLGLLRWYPQLNTYNLVEMAQTDETGRSIMRVKTEDVDYRVALWDVNGTLIKLNDPTRFACLTQPCTYSFTVFPSDQDFTSITGIQQSLTFNDTTSKFSFIWNDPSQRTQTMNMTVYRETGLSIGQVCETIGTGATGAIQSCDLSGYTGQFRAVIYRTASPALPINQLVWNIGQAISTVAARMGLFIAAILAIAGFFIGIFNPIIGIIMQIVALVPSFYLGSITMSVIIGAAIMGVVVIHFMRRIFS